LGKNQEYVARPGMVRYSRQGLAPLSRLQILQMSREAQKSRW